MSTSFYERVLYEIRKRQAFYQDKIITGNLTIDEYKSMTGKFIGLQDAEEAVMVAYRSLFEDRIKE